MNELTSEKFTQALININVSKLKMRPEVKKYFKVRKIYEDVSKSMINNLFSGRYPIKEYTEKELKYLKKEVDKPFYIDLDLEDQNDAKIFQELFLYKNSKVIPSMTETYLKSNRFKVKEKINMLKAMNNSFASLFKIINTDIETGYITVMDVFTNKEYKFIDAAFCTNIYMIKKTTIYIYTRLITYNGITFSTGLPCMFYGMSAKLRRYINKCKNNLPGFLRCLYVYDIYRENPNVQISYRN